MRAAIAALSLLCAAPAAAEPLYDAVDAYAFYQTDISTLATLDVRDQDTMDEALLLALRHDPARVASGYLAYGALTAAQAPEFVAGVRSRISAAGRAPVLRQLNADITYARRRPPGSAQAIALILASSSADSARMVTIGARYTELADTIAFAASDRGGRDQRSERLRDAARTAPNLSASFAARVHPSALSAAPLTDAASFGGARFWDALVRRDTPAPPTIAWREANAARVNRMLTLSGLFIAEAGATPRVREMLDDTRLRECLAMEQLELRQCASVAASANEDAHCLARHGLTQPAACFAEIAAPP